MSWLVLLVLAGSIAGSIAGSMAGEPLAELDRLRRTPAPDPARVQAVLDEGLSRLGITASAATRPRQCGDTFQAGELYRLAAASAPDAGYDDRALELFREMRVTFIDLLAGSLGHIGEARVHRQRGDGVEALAALQPLLADDADPRLRGVAEIEAAEAELLFDVELAIARAAAVGPGGEWVLARAYAKKGDRERALELARGIEVVKIAAPYERLDLIARQGILDDGERFTWANVLLQHQREAEALALLDERCPPAPLASRLYAPLLERAGRPADAVPHWEIVAEDSTDPVDRLSLVRALMNAGSTDARDRAITVSREVAASDAPIELRQDGLRRWVTLAGFDGARPGLESHPDLVAGDPFLRYARVAARRDDEAPERLAAELAALEAEIIDDELRAVTVLLRTQIMPDRRGALKLLQDHWDLVSAQPATGRQAESVRAAIWLELGMVDDAADDMIADPQRHPARSLLAVAAALADRFANGFAATTSDRVVRLAAAAIRRDPTDERVAIRAARLMLDVEAFGDADRVLASVASPDALLLRAEVARRLDRPREALAMIDGVTSVAAELLRGQCQLDLGQAEPALVSIRSARRQAREGSHTWWEATLALARAQISLGNRDAAAAVLRVAETLHPLGETSPLQRGLEAVKEELD